MDNGARLETYTIAGERGSGEMKVNGAAARLVNRGDTIIVISYGSYDTADLTQYDAPRRPRRRTQRDPQHRQRGGDPARDVNRRLEETPPTCPQLHDPQVPHRLEAPLPMTLPRLAEKKRLASRS